MPNYRYSTPSDQVDGDATLTNQVYQTLREEILNGQLKPGTRLVRRAVSARLGVSRMPVADALVRLEQDGLVESRPMIGARVVPLTPQRLRDDQVMREALECQAA
ncbi:MAG TPA: GntR family transcriptional regulator, partial [Phycisphaeraceae bacterium]